MTREFVTAGKEGRVAEVLNTIRTSRRTHESVSYVYIIGGEDKQLVGVWICAIWSSRRTKRRWAT